MTVKRATGPYLPRVSPGRVIPDPTIQIETRFSGLRPGMETSRSSDMPGAIASLKVPEPPFHGAWRCHRFKMPGGVTVSRNLPASSAPALPGAVLILASTNLAYVAVLLAAVLLIAVAALSLAILVVRLGGLGMLGVLGWLVHGVHLFTNETLPCSKPEACGRRPGPL